eukprot:5094756-Pyramimonas_sp.AAC.1
MRKQVSEGQISPAKLSGLLSLFIATDHVGEAYLQAASGRVKDAGDIASVKSSLTSASQKLASGSVTSENLKCVAQALKSITSRVRRSPHWDKALETATLATMRDAYKKLALAPMIEATTMIASSVKGGHSGLAYKMATTGDKTKLDDVKSRISELLGSDSIDEDSGALPVQTMKSVREGLRVIDTWLEHLNAVLLGKESIAQIRVEGLRAMSSMSDWTEALKECGADE